MPLLLVVILIIVLLVVVSRSGVTPVAWGYAPDGLAGLLAVILIILLLMGYR